jgi:hypothetical protein
MFYSQKPASGIASWRNFHRGCLLCGHASADPKDAQLSGLDGMLDKVLEIKYPNRGQGKVDSIERRTFSVSRINGASVSFNGGTDGFSNRGQDIAGQEENQFYSLDDGPATETGASVIHAVIPNRPTLISGARVRLRLDDDITVHGVVVPKNSFVWGIENFSGQRMNVRISSIEFKGRLCRFRYQFMTWMVCRA